MMCRTTIPTWQKLHDQNFEAQAPSMASDNQQKQSKIEQITNQRSIIVHDEVIPQTLRFFKNMLFLFVFF